MALWVLRLVIPLLLLLKNMKQMKTLNKQLPPSPPRLPILGNLHQIGGLPHQSYRELCQKYVAFLDFELEATLWLWFQGFDKDRLSLNLQQQI
ncbi:hypothetical protein ACOSQ2_018827 [Xanthoceras sorbifolium]